MPPPNPIGFTPADWFVIALTAVFIVAGYLWRPAIQKALKNFAQRRRICFVALLLLPVLLRLLLLSQHPVPTPEIYDEFSHLLVADTLWHGRLANPPHAMHEFFETFFEVQRPSYSSIYSLGPGLMLSLGRLISGVPWTGVLMTSGALCAFCYWMLLGWVPPDWALLGGIFALILFGPLCQWTNTYWGGSLAAMAGCLVFGALPRLRSRALPRDAVALGFGFGLHMLTRQFETLLLLMAIGLFLLPAAFDSSFRRRPSRSAILALVAVFPAIVLTLLQNKAVTGDWLTIPEALSQYQYGVPTSLTFQAVPIPHVALTPQQEMDYHAQSAMHGAGPDSILKYLLRLEYRVRYYRFFFLPPLYVAIIASLFAIKERKFLFALGALTVYSLGTNFFPYLLPHYLAAVTCLFVLVSIKGLQQITRIRLRGHPIGLEIAQILIVLCLAEFATWYSLHLFETPAFYPLLRFETWDGINHQPSVRRFQVREQLQAISGKLLVFVRYSPRHVYQDEWVWNAADIDASQVVYARDLGAIKNRDLIGYYPNRKVFLLEPDTFNPTLTQYKVDELSNLKN